MLKLIPLLFALLPINNAIAEQTDTNNVKLKADNEKADNEKINTDISIASSASLKEKSEPRNVRAFFKQCYRNVPAYTAPPRNVDRNKTPVNISAGALSGLNNEIFYQGDVLLVQGDKTLAADTLTYNRTSEQAKAIGNTKFVNGQITLLSNKIETNLGTDETSLYETRYQLHGQGGRGKADLIYDNGHDLYQLDNSSYTACPPEDTTWSIESSDMYLDNVAEVGTAYNAVLKIKDIPVFYFPYINYPLTDRRKTGFLFPTYDSSTTNGISISQPFYINITPNQDATITPTYMQERGLLLTTEYRYLFDIGEGTIQTEYINDDKILDDERYLLHFDHNVDFSQDWNLNAEYNLISDDSYFSDIETDYGDRSDDQLLQTAKLSYTKMNWNAELEVRNFQILGDGDTPHIVLPKLAFNLYQPLFWESLQFDLYSEITQFSHADDDVYTGTRIHTEPKLSLPLYYNSMFINTELKYIISAYQQDRKDAAEYQTLAESVVRYLPSFKIHSGINLERDFSLFENNYRQTLVPQMQYLYVPYQDQSSIGLYDTTTLQQDYYGLFRDNRYSGYDRIADANQITIGLSSSFLNQQGKERLRFAIGQNYYLSESKVTLPTFESETINNESEEEVNRSSLISEFDVNFDNNYFLHAGIEWNSDENIIQRANTTLEKRWAYNTFLQLSYRYYKQAEDAEWYEVVNQIGSKINWSIDDQWTAFASYYYGVEYSNAYESIVGLKYQSCCWALGLTYDRHMLPNQESEYIASSIETESNISLTIELMGLGGVGETTSDQGLFDYGRPFYLK